MTTIVGYGRGAVKTISLQLIVHPNQPAGGGGYIAQPQGVPIAYATPDYSQQQAISYGQAPPGSMVQMTAVPAVSYAPVGQKMDM
jgi:hypothetical protein